MLTQPVEPTRDATLWRSIANDLERRIVSGALAPGERLPTEHEFAETFGVNRHTVRRALRDLQQRGLLEITQGRGSFVRRRPMGCVVTAEPHLCEGVRLSLAAPPDGGEAVERVDADADVAEALGVAVGSQVFAVSMTAQSADEPLALLTHFLSRDVGSKLPELCKTLGSLDAALSALGKTRGRRGDARVRARAASLDEMRRLRLPKHAPTLLMDAIVYDAEGAPLEFVRTRFASDRVEIVLDFARAA